MNDKPKKEITMKEKNNTPNTPPPYTFLSGAQHYVQPDADKAWQPSDEAVEEMRDFSIEHRE